MGLRKGERRRKGEGLRGRRLREEGREDERRDKAK